MKIERLNIMKYKLLPILLILLCACSSKSTTITVNDPLSYSVNIKDDAEYILVKEGTSIEEATQIILDNLDIETNADSYELEWYGEMYAELTREDLETVVSKKDNVISEREPYADVHVSYLKYAKNFGDVKESQELTLNHDSIRPIELIFDFTKDGETITYYKEILLCVARDTQYNIIDSISVDKTIENLYQTLDAKTNQQTVFSYARDNEGYVSNIRNYYGWDDVSYDENGIITLP